VSREIGVGSEETGTFFSIDAFGALVSEPVPALDDSVEDTYVMGLNIFNLVNSA
jgi:hypothetical protein